MDFGFTSEQELLRRTAREFLGETVPMTYVRAVMADARGTDAGAWTRMAALGWLGLVLPEAYGGSGLSMQELAIVLEEMGRVVMPGPFLATTLGGLAVLAAGSEAQRRRWLPGIADGSRTATFALAEASGRFDAAGVAAVVEAAPEGLRLSGRKLFVPDAASADLLVCALRRVGDGALALVVVERGAPGLDVVALESMDRTRPLYAVSLDGVAVGADQLLAGDAETALACVLDQARVALAAEMCGGAERVLELTVEYAKVRRQFDRPIGAFQAIQHACADMLLEVEKAKTATAYAAWAAGAADAALAAAMAKATAGEAYRQVVARAIQVHGGIGFTWEHDLHVYFRRAHASEAMFGDAGASRELVAQRLAD